MFIITIKTEKDYILTYCASTCYLFINKYLHNNREFNDDFFFKFNNFHSSEKMNQYLNFTTEYYNY